jgi:hypothetical protein
MAIKSKLALCAVIILGTVSSGLAASQPSEPYGTPRSAAAMRVRHGSISSWQSILGSRDTSEYIQDLGNLESNGMSEYDVMVGRCMDKFYHQWTRVHGNQPTYGGSFGG